MVILLLYPKPGYKMKKRMKAMFWILLMAVEPFAGFAQAIELNYGCSLFPADYISLRYTHYTNSEVNLAANLFLENTQKYGLHYSAYGTDILAQYVLGRGEETSSIFSFTGSLGLTGHVESEPWAYQDWPLSKRINYGFVAEVSGEWLMSQIFGLNLFAQQKWLFNKALGNTGFVFGLGLVYHIN